MKVTFNHLEDVANHIKIFWFKSEKPMRYIAGQYTEFELPHENQDDRGQKRWFTLSSSPTEPMLAITTKFAEQPSSFKSAMLKLKPGDKLNFADAMGDFVLPKDKLLPILFVAGGIGVTPMRSMTKYLLDSGEKRNIKLLYAVRQVNELAFLPLFEQADIEVMPIVEQPPDNWSGLIGKLDAKKIVAQAKDQHTIIYISGPEPMVESFEISLGRLWPKHQIRTDFFPGYKAI